jgi:DNA-directed RNA polymerase specialized sigma24 family protein
VTSSTPKPLDEAPEAALAVLHEDPGYRDVLGNPDAFLEHCGDEVTRAMKNLSTPQRACILLRSAEKFSYREISEILEMPVGTVMTHLSRGRAKLRKELLEYARERGFVRGRPRILPKNEERGTGRMAESDGTR